MKLRDVLTAYSPLAVQGETDLEIAGFCTDSRRVQQGDVFIAIAGTSAAGNQFIADAYARGAVAVVCDMHVNAELPASMVRITVENPRIAAAKYAAAFYQPQPSRTIAVTGTDGKSSTVEFIRQLLERNGHAAASLGTIGITTSVALPPYEATNTTPDPVILHQRLQMLAEAGVEVVALEASSHGLHQYRLEGLAPEVGVFTTFGADHLDYHRTLDEYFAAKARLFLEVLSAGTKAVLNADHPQIISLRQACLSRQISVLAFGMQGDACQLHDAAPIEQGQYVHLTLGGLEWKGTVPLFGRFQVMNVLAASAALLALGMPPQSIVDAYSQLRGVRGRLELAARHPLGMPVFVDYAHTAQGLASALAALRPHTQGRLHVVFGCGGNRDTGKRPEMGAIATEFADSVIVTDDNPRMEDPRAIRQAILAAAPNAREIADRRAAIHAGMATMAAGDVLLIAGKGHETYQIVGEEKFPFDDAEEARDAVEQMHPQKTAL